MKVVKRRAAAKNVPPGIVKTSDDVGAWVHHARVENGVTLVDAAALSGVGVRFLLELEHGKSTASLGKVLQVLKRLGLEVEIRPRGRRSHD
jgi:transcriptional regulator with XRE-family HTH domain